MFAEVNCKCRKLKCEKRLIEHPQPGAQPLNVIFAHVLISTTRAVRQYHPDRLSINTFTHFPRYPGKFFIRVYDLSSHFHSRTQRPPRNVHNCVSTTEHAQLAQDQRRFVGHQFTLRSCNVQPATHSSALCWHGGTAGCDGSVQSVCTST